MVSVCIGWVPGFGIMTTILIILSVAYTEIKHTSIWLFIVLYVRTPRCLLYQPCMTARETCLSWLARCVPGMHACGLSVFRCNVVGEPKGFKRSSVPIKLSNGVPCAGTWCRR